MGVSPASNGLGSHVAVPSNSSISPVAIQNKNTSGVVKISTGVPGFDEISHGGLPRGRTTLISGTSGSGKTIFAMQFLVSGILRYGENGVFVTFEETPSDISANMKSFGWEVEKYLNLGKFAYVDASPSEEDSIELGEFDLGAFMARLVYAINKVQAKRLAIDSISALFPRYTDQALIRRELFKISSKLKKIGVTTLITGERLGETDVKAGRFGVEEFVSDNVVLLHNQLDELNADRKRSVEILKFRGTTHETQDTPLLVRLNGINVFPRPKLDYKKQVFPAEKHAVGVDGLDDMLFGGLFKNSITLVTGPSGVGKTVLSLNFVVEGAKRGEKGLIFAFEESENELFRNADSLGLDLKRFTDEGMIRIFSSVPEKLRAEEHFKHIQEICDTFNISRFVLDSLSALSRIYSPVKFREFTIGLNAYLKSKGIISIINETTQSLMEISQASSTHYSSSADNVILMKYLEYEGTIRRVISVLKARGADHDKRLRELLIDRNGIKVGEPFVGIKNILGGEK